MRVLDRFSSTWQDVSSVVGKYYYLAAANSSLYDTHPYLEEWEILEVYPRSALHTDSLLRVYPGLFDVIAAENQLYNGDWTLYDEAYNSLMNTWKHREKAGLRAETYNGHIVMFSYENAGTFFYSAKYDKVILYRVEGYWEPSETNLRLQTAYSVIPYIKPLYEGAVL